MPPQPQLRVGAAQINCDLGNIPANLETHRRLIDRALDRQLDLLVFPELSLTGYGLGRHVPNVALPADSETLAELAEASGSLQLVVGFVEEASPGEYYNALAILQDGRIQAIHRKLNLPTYGGLEEGKWFTPGNSLTQHSVAPGWPAQHLICADLWNPGLVHQAMMQRPALLCAPINSASGIVSDDFSNERNWLINVQFYAMTYGTPVIMANRYGEEGDSWFWGGSCILGPRGEALARAEEGEQLITTTLTRQSIAQARFDLPTHRDAECLSVCLNEH
ncbi:MAG: nitrilase-related carbon-nitrogen hydrolase [Marinobacter sp.]|nr:nitrilase-related carbon-nitrogen hydrolase [Marinobacter sp.]